MKGEEKERCVCSPPQGQMSARPVLAALTSLPHRPQTPRSVHTGLASPAPLGSAANGLGWGPLSISEPRLGPRLMQNTHSRALPRRDRSPVGDGVWGPPPGGVTNQSIYPCSPLPCLLLGVGGDPHCGTLHPTPRRQHWLQELQPSGLES